MSQRLLSILVLVLTAVLFILGCASIIHGTRQEVFFQSSPAGAQVEVSDDVGVSYGLCETPCSIELKRKNKYVVTISKNGYESIEMLIERKSDGWIWGNILIGGLIGLIIDFSNGAAYKLSPSEIMATLSKESLGGIELDKDPSELIIIDYATLSAEEKTRMERMRIPPIIIGK
jgi:hypothetical protein